MALAGQRATYTEYLEFEDRSEQRHEFVDGAIYAMADSTPEHSRLAAALTAELYSAVAAKGCAAYGCNLRLRIEAANRSTYADGVVICGPVMTSHIDPDAVTNPTVIVEVLSPSTEASDRGDKWHHYQRIDSLREYASQGTSPKSQTSDLAPRRWASAATRASIVAGSTSRWRICANFLAKLIGLPQRGCS